MAENGRLAETQAVFEKFEELMMASRGEVRGIVTSAEVFILHFFFLKDTTSKI